MALTPGHPTTLMPLRLAEQPPVPDEIEEVAGIVDAMDRIAIHLATVVLLSKIAALLLVLLVLGVGLRLLGVG